MKTVDEFDFLHFWTGQIRQMTPPSFPATSYTFRDRQLGSIVRVRNLKAI